MKEIDILDSKFGEIRTFEEQGEVLFVAVDVARALGYTDLRQAIQKNCTFEFNPVSGRPPLKLETQLLDANGRMQTYRLIDEPNLYKLIFSSKLGSAQTFTEWVAKDVLPTIRKFGTYPAPEISRETLQAPSLRSSSSREAVTATQLLKEHDSLTTVKKFFDLCEEHGVVSTEQVTITQRVLEDTQYGSNERAGHKNQVVFYRQLFDSLLTKLGI